MNDLTFFTNEPGSSLLDRFKKTLKDVQFFDVLVGYFRTTGFFNLYQELENIEKIRILVGINADSKTVELIDFGKQNTFDFESHSKTKEIFSDNLQNELYQAEDSYNVELGILKFIEFIRLGKLEIKAYPSKNIHAKVYISRFHSDDRDFGRVITGSSNFSESGLNGNYEFNVELKNSSDVKYALEKFEKLWLEGVPLSDEFIDTINTKTWLNQDITPYELYLKFIYEYFKEDINTEDAYKIYLPEGFLELKYQKQAVSTIKKILDQYNGTFVSDVVGLGKTYICAMFAQNLEGKKLVICPPPIKDSWEDAFRDFGVRNFEIESLGKLHKIIKKDPEKYDYIFVDEAHRFRNEDTDQYKLLHQICLSKKVILISATPLNNSVYDFFALIKLFQPPRNSDIPGMPDYKGFFDNARYTLAQYNKNDPEYLEEVKKISKQVRDKILKYLMVRRTRTDVLKYFKKDVEQQNLFFPKINSPERIIYKFDEKTNKVFNRTIGLIKSLTYARYKPVFYLNKQTSAFEQQQEANLAGFIKSRLVKRLESSNYSFKMSIDRFIASYDRFIKMYQGGTVYVSKKVNVYDYLENDNEEELLNFVDDNNDQSIVKKYKTEDFNDNFLPDLMSDLQMLKKIQSLWNTIDIDHKLIKFVYELQNDKNLINKKIIVFTESKETGEYIYKRIEELLPHKSLFFSSSFCLYKNERLSNIIAKDIIKENYDPGSKNHKDDIQILITTDVLAEGINLHRSNIVINYDLPWNPTRVLQRIGRVNRVGTKHKSIFIFNFFPTSETDEELNLEDSIKAKIQAFHETLGEDAKYLTEDEVFTNHKLFGEELYKKLNSKETYEEDESEENIELKYLAMIRNIRDKETSLFEKIKRLPKKARAAKKFKALKEDNLITFFRKGKLKKFYITNGKKSEELTFEDAVQFFECDIKTPKEKINKKYFDFLDLNKQAFVLPSEDEMIHSNKKGSRSNENYVIERIKIAIRDKQKLTDDQEEYLANILQVFQEGLIPSKISRDIKNKIENELDSISVCNTIRKKIPDIYLYTSRKNQSFNNDYREIILSEYLNSGDEDNA